MAENLLAPDPASLGFGNPQPLPAGPQGPSAFTQEAITAKRKASQTVADKVGAMVREDSVIPGMVRTLVGDHMAPDPTYDSYTDPAIKELQKGLPVQFHNELLKAHSPAHLQYIGMALRQKMQDQQVLDDLGLPGEVGRFALGALMPENYIAGLGAGGFARGVAMLGARKTALAAAVDTARVAAGATRGGAVASGAAFGAAENAAIEAARQRFNFESDGTGIAVAGLMGAAFTAPFAYHGARFNGSVAAKAAQELKLLEPLQRLQDGRAISHEDARLITASHDIHKALGELEAGRITPAEFEARTAEPMGPFEPPSVWMERYGGRLKSDADQLIKDLFPGSTGKATGMRPLSEPQKAASDEAIRMETLTNFPEPTPAKAGMPLSAMQQAFADAKLKAGIKTPELPAVLPHEAAAAELRKVQEDAAWAGHRAGQDARRTREESAIAAAWDHVLMTNGQEPLHALLDAKDTRAGQRGGAANEAPPAPPKDASHYIGQEVHFADKSGDLNQGTVESVNSIGKLLVRDEDGKLHSVDHTTISEHRQAGEAPEGFLPGSVGAAQAARIVGVWEQRTVGAKLRFDYFALLNGSQTLGVRQLAFRMMKDAIGVDKEEAQGWTASEYKKDITRRIGGRFHVEMAAAERDAVVLAQVPFWKSTEYLYDFRELVTRAVRNDPDVAREAGAALPAVNRAAKAMREAYADALKEAQQHRVKGAVDTPPDDLYVNRVWNHDRIREAEALHTPDAVAHLVAQSINVPGYTGDLAKAKQFLGTIKKLEFDNQTQMVHLQGRDMGTLRTELSRTNLTPSEIDNLVDIMFDARAASGGDAGQAASLKFRFDINENHSAALPTGTLRVSDLFQNDSRVLMDSYLNSMGGHIGLAKVGIDSAATFEAKLRAIGEEALAAGQHGKKLADELQMLRDVHANITGKPMSGDPNSKTARVAQGFRALTRSASLGQLGVVAMFEMHKAVSLMGLSAVWQSLPAFRHIITALRQGYAPSDRLARDIMEMSGFGSELAHSYHAKTDLSHGAGAGNYMLTRFEAATNKLSHVTDHISGNASVTSVTRSVAAQAATRQAFEFSSGKAMPAKLRERWVTQGLDANEIDVVLKDLKDHSTASGGRLESIDYETWHKNEPETYDKFRLFISRQAREAIQDQDIGETMPWMHTTLGKVLAELRTFMLVGHAKNFLKNTAIRDQTAFNVWFLGLVSESLAYSLQQAVNNPDQLDKRLEMGEMARSVSMRMAAMGAMPLLIASVYGAATGEDFLKPGSTANTDSRSILKTASFNELVRLGNIPTTLSGALGAHGVTKHDVTESIRAMPFARVLGMPLAAQAIGDFFPTSVPGLKQQR